MPGTVGSKRGPSAAAPAPPASAGLGRFQRGLDLLLELVEPLPGLRLVGLVDRAEAFLGRLEPAALHAQELDPRSLQGRGVAGRLESGQGIAVQLVKFGKKFRQRHGYSNPKSEARNPKQIRMQNGKERKTVSFDHSSIRHLNLFRISSIRYFGFPAVPAVLL